MASQCVLTYVSKSGQRTCSSIFNSRATKFNRSLANFGNSSRSTLVFSFLGCIKRGRGGFWDHLWFRYCWCHRNKRGRRFCDHLWDYGGSISAFPPMNGARPWNWYGGGVSDGCPSPWSSYNLPCWLPVHWLVFHVLNKWIFSFFEDFKKRERESDSVGFLGHSRISTSYNSHWQQPPQQLQQLYRPFFLTYKIRLISSSLAPPYRRPHIPNCIRVRLLGFKNLPLP